MCEVRALEKKEQILLAFFTIFKHYLTKTLLVMMKSKRDETFLSILN